MLERRVGVLEQGGGVLDHQQCNVLPHKIRSVSLMRHGQWIRASDIRLGASVLARVVRARE